MTKKKRAKAAEPLSMYGLWPEDALRGAMQVHPPHKGKAKKARKRPRRKP